MAIKIALAGNPNSGKTTLFNALTGSNQFVGNWPGVTVEKKEGKLKGHKDVVIMDLPGIYSLSPYTLEEVVARNYLISERPDAILNIVDGTNIERNLYLSTQLMELGIPVVMAVNMMDLVERNGDQIDTVKLGKELGCEVIEISALKGTGIRKAAEKAVAAAGNHYKKTPIHKFCAEVELVLDGCEVIEISALKGTGIRKAAEKAVAAAGNHYKKTPIHKFCAEVELVLDAIEGKIRGSVPEEQERFFAIKLLEKDDKIQTQFGSALPDVSEEIDQIEKRMEDDTESIITNERYLFISSIIGSCCQKNRDQKLTPSDKIDRIVTNRWLALPIFAIVMTLVYYVSVSTVGTWATDWANDGVFGEGWHLFGIDSIFIPGIPTLWSIWRRMAFVWNRFYFYSWNSDAC